MLVRQYLRGLWVFGGILVKCGGHPIVACLFTRAAPSRKCAFVCSKQSLQPEQNKLLYCDSTGETRRAGAQMFAFWSGNLEAQRTEGPVRREGRGRGWPEGWRGVDMGYCVCSRSGLLSAHGGTHSKANSMCTGHCFISFVQVVWNSTPKWVVSPPPSPLPRCKALECRGTRQGATGKKGKEGTKKEEEREGEGAKDTIYEWPLC